MNRMSNLILIYINKNKSPKCIFVQHTQRTTAKQLYRIVKQFIVRSRFCYAEFKKKLGTGAKPQLTAINIINEKYYEDIWMYKFFFVTQSGNNGTIGSDRICPNF